MGKASRKMAKQQQKKEGKNRAQDIKNKEEICRTQITEEKFNEALGTIAEIAQTGHKDADIMYLAAYCYFMTGDYDRAATWINNTLSYDGGHLKARILLARLCMLQERDDDGLAIFDFVLEHGLKSLGEEDTREIEEILEYFVRNEADKLQLHYPHIASFMDITGTEAASSEVIEDKDSAPIISEVSADCGDFTEDAEWQGKCREIFGKDISVAEKVKVLNTFSGAYYFDKKYDAACGFLEAALKLDGHNENSLKNMAILQAERGNTKEALEYAAKLAITDFQLLHMIRAL